MKKERVVSFLLRIGLASVFGYAAIAAFLDPISWVGYFPKFIRDMIPEHTLLTLFSIGELILAAWLLWGRYVFFAGILSASVMLGIIISNLTLLDVVFRDIAIFFSSIALSYLDTQDHYHA
ncbi:hypothetical protein HY621_01510 [Candidatus Uhrbacteria bacterium]|nr:hypothetical protein [Candidatus Uhrbacteria bacterium]